MKVVKEHEQEQMKAGGTLCRKNNKHTHLLRRRLNGMVGGRVRGEMSRGNGKKISTIA